LRGEPGRAFSRGELLDRVWGTQHEGYEHTVNTHINRLRSKIGAGLIHTVWGRGYRFEEPSGGVIVKRLAAARSAHGLGRASGLGRQRHRTGRMAGARVSRTASDAQWQAQSLDLARYVVQRHAQRLGWCAGAGATDDALADIGMYITLIHPSLEAYLLTADGGHRLAHAAGTRSGHERTSIMAPVRARLASALRRLKRSGPSCRSTATIPARRAGPQSGLGGAPWGQRCLAVSGPARRSRPRHVIAEGEGRESRQAGRHRRAARMALATGRRGPRARCSDR
jgi:hypothetical protein